MRYDGHSRPTGALYAAALREHHTTRKRTIAFGIGLAATIMALTTLLFAMPAKAQRYAVVATCGTLTQATPPVGSAGIITIDQNGVLCTSSTGSGGGAVTVADGADVAQGITTDAACATDNGTCTVIQLLKRENQRLTTLITNLGAANANGQATMANSSPVAIASNQTANALWGQAPTGAAVPANGVLQGVRGQNAEQTAVANGQLTGMAADLVGKPIVLPYANPENFVSGTTAAMTGTTSTSLVASPGGSLRNYITHLSCVNSHASVGTFVTVQDGSGGTSLMTLAAGSVYGGEAVALMVPLKQPTAATALFVANVTTGANVICNAIGYKGL